jgi:hypothetical protein
MAMKIAVSVLMFLLIANVVHSNPNQYQISAEELRQRRAMYSDYAEYQKWLKNRSLQIQREKSRPHTNRYAPRTPSNPSSNYVKPKGFYAPKKKSRRIGG